MKNMKTKKMKIAAMALLLAGIFYSCEDYVSQSECNCKDELFYYNYKGEKQFLSDSFLNDQLCVTFDPQVEDKKIVDYLNQTGFFKKVDASKIIYTHWYGPESHSERGETCVFVTTKTKKNCSRLKEIIRTLEKASIVKSADLVFTCDSKCMISFTSYIYVSLKDKDDMHDLYAVMEETNTWINERIDPVFPGCVYVEVNKNPKGNALQMANYFYETGKFASAEPYFVVLSDKKKFYE